MHYKGLFMCTAAFLYRAGLAEVASLPVRLRCDPGFRRWTGALPLFEALVRARGGAIVTRAAPPSQGVAPVQIIPAGRQSSRLRGRHRGQRSRAAETQQTTARPLATTGTPGGCA